jgi:RNA 2',3'-cyclic 3'-phosphodiesterase
MPTRRLFFALWPDADVRAGIVARRERLGRISRRQVPVHNLHLTLLFLGDQPAGRIDAIEGAAGRIKADACTLTLDRFGWFPRAGVTWLGGEAPAELDALAVALKTAMEPLGLTFDARPFCPHVTLFRQVRRRPDFPEIEPLEWPMSEFALVESIPGQPYQVLRKWGVE